MESICLGLGLEVLLGRIAHTTFVGDSSDLRLAEWFSLGLSGFYFARHLQQSRVVLKCSAIVHRSALGRSCQYQSRPWPPERRRLEKSGTNGRSHIFQKRLDPVARQQ